MCDTFLNFFRHSRRRYLLWLLLAANVCGSVFGYYWYWNQLSVTPLYLWLFVPDCPFYTTLFSLIIVGWMLGFFNPLLHLITLTGLIKYGAWAIFVLMLSLGAGGETDSEWLLLLFSHMGMILEGILFFGFLKWKPSFILINALWMLANDLVDYLAGTHPVLPSIESLPIVVIFTLGSTVLISLILCLGTFRQKNRHKI